MELKEIATITERCNGNDATYHYFEMPDVSIMCVSVSVHGMDVDWDGDDALLRDLINFSKAYDDIDYWGELDWSIDYLALPYWSKYTKDYLHLHHEVINHIKAYTSVPLC